MNVYFLYVVGSSTKVSFLNPATVSSEAAAVWQLSADDIGDGDILDSDTLLDEKDMKNPAPEELKADCGGSVKMRKSCKWQMRLLKTMLLPKLHLNPPHRVAVLKWNGDKTY